MKTFALYDAFGQPIAGASVSFAYFGSRLGVPTSPPTITDMGGGNYQFQDLTYTGEYVYLIQVAGAVFPKYLFGGINSDPLVPFGVLFFTNPDGTLWTSAGTPSFVNYKTFTGGSPSAPAIVRVNTTGPGRALYTFSPTNPDLTAGVEYIVQAPTGAIPEYYDGTLYPETGGGGPGPAPVVHLVSGAVFTDHINLTFDKNIALSSLAAIASNWTITTVGGNTPLVVSSIQVTGNTVRLNINEASDGGAYTIHLPTAGIESTVGDIYLGPFVYNFIAVGVPPYIANAISVDTFTVRVFYSEAVVEADAVIIGNYGVSPPLTIYSVTPETASVYVLTTSAQTPGQSYTLTVNNVRDLHNNPV